MKMKQQTGFTLVETLVAITVLLVGVIGPLSIAARGIGDGLYARNQLAANYLAQEALEVIINKRGAAVRKAQSDDNIIWNDEAGLTSCLGASSGVYCSVDAKTAIVGAADCNDSPNYTACQLVFNNNSYLYQNPSLDPDPTHNIGPIFTRKVHLETVATDSTGITEVRATVTVDWKNKDIPKSLTIVEYLFSKGG